MLTTGQLIVSLLSQHSCRPRTHPESTLLRYIAGCGGVGWACVVVVVIVGRCLVVINSDVERLGRYLCDRRPSGLNRDVQPLLLISIILLTIGCHVWVPICVPVAAVEDEVLLLLCGLAGSLHRGKWLTTAAPVTPGGRGVVVHT